MLILVLTDTSKGGVLPKYCKEYTKKMKCSVREQQAEEGSNASKETNVLVSINKATHFNTHWDNIRRG